MGRKRHHPPDIQEQILETEQEILRVERKILHNQHQRTANIAVRFTGEHMANNILALNVGQSSTATIVPLLADGVTPSGGTLSKVSFTFSDPSATVTLNADGLTATVIGVAPNTAPVGGTASATVTDTDGATAQFSQAFLVSVNAVVPPSQLTQSIAVQFSTPA